MMFEVGGTFLSQEKHPDNRVTIDDRYVLRLEYTGFERTRYGTMYAYRVIAVEDTKKKPPRRLSSKRS